MAIAALLIPLQICGYCCQLAACTCETLKKLWWTLIKIITCGQGIKGFVFNFLSLVISEEDPDDKDFVIPVLATRCATDIPSLLFFIALLVGMIYTRYRVLKFHNTDLYVHGADSYLNICGRENHVFPTVLNSGQNMKNFSRVLLGEFITDPGEIDFTRDYTYLCVTACPSAINPFSCADYVAANTPYGGTFATDFCMESLVKTLPEFTIMNGRCVPTGSFGNLTSVTLENSLLNLYSNNWVQDLVHDCREASAELTWLVLISVACSFVFMLVIHSAAQALCWYSFTSFFIVGVASICYMWYLYSLISQNNITLYSDGGIGRFPTNDNGTVTQSTYKQTIFDISITTTVVFGVFSVVSVITGRRNVVACATVFEAGIQCMAGVKWLYILPFLSLVSVFFALWIWTDTITHATAIFLSVPDIQYDLVANKGTFIPDTKYSTQVLILQFFGIIWIFNFILGCQHLIACIAIGTYYFTIHKEEMYRPIRVASSRLVRKHLGSAVAGGLLVGFFGFLRAPLSFLQSRIVTGTERAWKAYTEEEKKKEEEDLDDEDDIPIASQGINPHHLHRSERRIQMQDYAEEEYVQAVKTTGLRSENVEKYKEDAENEEEVLESPPRKGPDPALGIKVWGIVNTCFFPIFWILNNLLVYLSDLNYAVVALESFWFLQSGRWIRDRLKDNPNLKGITAISSYAFFLQELTVTLVILPIGFLLLKDKEGIFLYGYPLAVSALLSFIIAHVFFSLLEASTGAAFVCYLEDNFRNDGDLNAPYFGKKTFFIDFLNALNEVSPTDAPLYEKVHFDDRDDLELGPHGRKKRKETENEDEDEDSGEDDKEQKFSRQPNKPIVIQPASKFTKRYLQDDEDDEFDDALEGKKRKSEIPIRSSKVNRRSYDDNKTHRRTPSFPRAHPRPTPPHDYPASRSLPPRPPLPSPSPPRPRPPRPKAPQRPKAPPTPSPPRAPLPRPKAPERPKAPPTSSPPRPPPPRPKAPQRAKTPSSSIPSRPHPGSKPQPRPEAGRRSSDSKRRKDEENDGIGDIADVIDEAEKHKKNRKVSKNKPQHKQEGTKKAEDQKKANLKQKEKAKKRNESGDQKESGKKNTRRQSKTKSNQKAKTNLSKKNESSKIKTHSGERGRKTNKTPRGLKPKSKSPTQSKSRSKSAPRKKTGLAAKKGKSFSSTKIRKVGKGKIPKLAKGVKRSRSAKSLKSLKGKIKLKSARTAQVTKLKGGKFKIPKMAKGLRGPKMGAAGAVAGGVTGVMDITDGLLRITGKKKKLEEMAENAAYGSRKRAKATNLISHVVDNRMQMFGPGSRPGMFRQYKLTKNLVEGGKKALQDVDDEWDEREAAEEEEEEDDEDEDESRRRRRRRRQQEAQ